MRLVAVLAVATLAACAESADLDPAEIAAPDDDGKADAATELSLRVGGTTVTVDRELPRRDARFVLHGRTSRSLEEESVRGYVFDDIFGEPRQPSPRVFEIDYGVQSIGPLFDGTDIFVGIGFVHSAGRADHLTARVIVRPRLGATAGSSTLAFTAELLPVVVGGTPVYRLQGRATKPLTAIAATAGGTATQAALIDATHFTIDLSRAQIIANAGLAGSPIVVTAQTATATVVRRAALGLAIKKFGLTAGDTYQTWPLPTCTAATRGCLLALPAGALDTSSCGEAVVVNACRREVGAPVDGATLNATRAAVDARLVGGFATDAIALTGADHAAGFTAALRTQTSAALDQLAGRWYLSAETRAAVLSKVVDGAFDGAYARPLALVAAHAPAPGDAAATAQVVADALLAHVATQDFAATALGRSLDALTRELRAQHVADVGGFRTGATEFVVDGVNDVYVGRWLGLYTEVAVARATGAAVRVLVEID